jgi:hypothetical protein
MDAIKVLRLALDVLTEKVVSVLSLVSGFALATWVMYEPDFYRLMTLIVFTVFSLLVTMRFASKTQKEE